MYKLGVVIYTKENCSFCKQAKAELVERNWDYEEKNIDADPTLKEELKSQLPEVKTVPQIWVRGKYVGGYTELMQYFEEHLGW